MRKKVEVTETHIRIGIKNNCCRCPVAHALHDAGFQDPEVGTQSLYYNRDDTVVKMGLTIRVRRFIKRFDADKPVKPIKFFVNV